MYARVADLGTSRKDTLCNLHDEHTRRCKGLKLVSSSGAYLSLGASASKRYGRSAIMVWISNLLFLLLLPTQQLPNLMPIVACHDFSLLEALAAAKRPALHSFLFFV